MSATASSNLTGVSLQAWLPLLDTIAQPLTPLEFGLLRVEVHGRAVALARALHLPDPARQAERLLGQVGRPALHAGHLKALTAPLPPAFARAFVTALGAAVPDDWESAATAKGPRLSLLRLPALRRLAQVQPTPVPFRSQNPADDLTLALEQLSASTGAVSSLTAALSREVLSGVTRRWLNNQAALHLELLSGLNAESSDSPGARAAQHVFTTLNGVRRPLARQVIVEARRQQLQLEQHQRIQAVVRREAVRACVRAARALAQSGHLTRVGQARWLTPHELRDALDGTLNPRALRELVRVRQERHEAEAMYIFHQLQTTPDRVLHGQALSVGVRDGRLHRWQPGVPVPAGAVLLAEHLPARAFKACQDVAALLLVNASVQGQATSAARQQGLCAISIPAIPDWCEDGALVRVDGHQGTLTLLRRAQDMPRPGAPEPFDLNLEATAALPHVRVVPREVASFSLDF